MNKKIWSAACGAIMAGAVGVVFAQAPTSSASQSPSTSADTVTVTGCVARADQSPTGTSGSTSTPATTPEAKFILTNAALSPSTSGATGTSGSATSATSIASEYKLDASDAKLSTHVGHKVEITGTVQQPSMSEQKPTASAANSPTLKVDTVKMVASTCSGQ
jgi:hypothetical protein